MTPQPGMLPTEIPEATGRSPASGETARAPVSGATARSPVRPSGVQRVWLARGLGQAGGKLPLFDGNGRRIDPRTVRRCMDEGWVEPWFNNPVKPDWLVCKLTPAGRAIMASR